ncbi:autotransporter domain-containing protein [Candidatus Pelagibacter sp.]|nr:autotransporter domain-containing protein [Candidatus Pelagibacter sp.]
MNLIVKKILYPKISSIAGIVTIILFFLFLGQSNIHAATCSDTSGTIVISSDCEDFQDSGSIDSLTINNGVTVDKSGTNRAIDLNETIGTITINGTVADDIYLNGNTITTIDIGSGASVTDNDNYTFYMNSGTTITNFTNAGTISNSSSNAVYNRNRITNLTNTGTISTTGNFGIQDRNFVVNLINSGTISAGADYGFYQGNTTTLIKNETGGTISAVGDYGIWMNSTTTTVTNETGATISAGGDYGLWTRGTIVTLTNQGTISAGGGYGVTLSNVTTFTNSGTISDADTTAVYVDDGHTVSNFENSGTLTSTNGDGILTHANATFTNLTITSASTFNVGTGQYDIDNQGAITTLNNGESQLSLNKNLPSNYNIIVGSTTVFGTLDVSNVAGTTTFGIDSSSSLSSGTYTNVITGVSVSNFSGGVAPSGTYGSCTWSLTTDGSDNWSLVASCNTNPSLSSSSPSDNATDVALDANIVLNFSENVDVETGNITIKKTSDNSTFETIDVTSSYVTGTGSTQITINPSSNFDEEVEYYILIDATAFDDSESGSYAGISSTTILSFTTESMTDPITDKDVVGSIDTQSQLAKNIVTQSTSTVSSRLNYLRQNRGNDNLSKNNIKLDFGNAILTSLTNELLAKNDKSIIPDNWSSWSEGSLSSSKIGDSLGSSSSETDAQALAFGFDTKLNDNDLLGFAIQYGQSDTNIGSSGSTTDSENINLSVYRTRPLNDDNFIEGMFGVGLIESDLVRVSGANTLTGSRNGTQIFGSINYGKTLDKGDFNLTPIARVDLGYTELDAYSETGTDALSYAKQSIESGLASLGLEFSDIVKFNDNKLKPFGSIEYGMDFSNSSEAKMNYVSDTTTIFTYSQGANSNHLVTSMVGFEYITKDNLEIISSYKRIQGNESEQTDILNVSVNFKSKRETEYAMSVDGSEDLKAGFDISKNVNGFNLKFNANQSLNENSDQTANVSLSRSF